MGGKPKVMNAAMQTTAVELFAQFYEFAVEVDKMTLNRTIPRPCRDRRR